MFKLKGWVVLKKNTFCVFGSLAILTLMFSPRSHLFGIFSFKNFNFLWMVVWKFTRFIICVNPGFDFTSPSLSGCANLKKIKIECSVICFNLTESTKTTLIVINNNYTQTTCYRINLQTKKVNIKWWRHSCI